METVAIRFQIQILESEKNIILISKIFVFFARTLRPSRPSFFEGERSEWGFQFFLWNKNESRYLCPECLMTEYRLLLLSTLYSQFTVLCSSYLTPPLPFDTLNLSYKTEGGTTIWNKSSQPQEMYCCAPREAGLDYSQSSNSCHRCPTPVVFLFTQPQEQFLLLQRVDQMTLRNTTDNYDLIDLDEMEAVPAIKNLKTVKKPNKPKSNVVRKVEKPLELKMIEAAIEQDSFKFSYHASRHEYGWIVDSLKEFYEQHWFEDILGKAKGGKEANVYICRAPEKIGKPLLAAKVYRPRMFRNLRKDHLYREGRENLDVNGKVVLDERAYHAMQKRSAYGLELLHTSWVGHEFLTMQVLYDGGVDLPRPYASSNNASSIKMNGYQYFRSADEGTISLVMAKVR